MGAVYNQVTTIREHGMNAIVVQLDGDDSLVNNPNVFHFINNLYDEVKDGLVLLKVMDKIKPGTVDWKKVAKKPKNNFESALNCD